MSILNQIAERLGLIEQAPTSTPIQQAANSATEADKPEPSHIDTPEREQTDSPPQILTAATASPDWLRARDQYIDHLMGCQACHAPTGRYCPASTSIRQTYALTHRRHTNSADSSN